MYSKVCSRKQKTTTGDLDMIPCLRNKCLKYPICIGKLTITCDSLDEYYRHNLKLNRDLANRHSKSWAALTIHLPNLQRIRVLTPVTCKVSRVKTYETLGRIS